MELYFKLAISCIIAAILSLLIKKYNPEISFLMVIVAVLGCIFTSITLLKELYERLQSIHNLALYDITGFKTLLKCVTVSVLSQITSCICKDGGHSATSVALEFAGNLAILICLSPLFATLFQMIGDLM